MKKILMLLLILFVTGCSAEYNLEIKSDSFKEEINISINKSEIPTENYSDEIELDDQITPIIENDYFAIIDNEEKMYKKEITETLDLVNIVFSYKYKPNEFEKSSTLNNCFENFEFDSQKNYYIHAFGEFYCLHTDSLNINIKTKNKVKSHNADNVEGNVYTWYVNESNVNNLDIKFEVSKGTIQKNIIKYASIFGTLLIVFLGVYYFINKKNKENNKI